LKLAKVELNQRLTGAGRFSLTKEQIANYVPLPFLLEGVMFKIVVQEAATLAALSLFVGMIAIWSQVIGSL
jgi:hypothetical protein